MPTISPYGLGTCRACLRPVRWATTEAGKQLALDPEPDEAGNTVARLGEGPGWWSRVPTAERPQIAAERRFMVHVATCPVRNPRSTPRPAPPPARRPASPQAHQEALMPLHAVLPLPPGVASLDQHRDRKGRP